MAIEGPGKRWRWSRSRSRLFLLFVGPLAAILAVKAVGWAAVTLKAWVDGDPLTAADLNANFNALKTAIEEAKPTVYIYEGALATPNEWEADLIFNGKYERFCQAIGKTYVEAKELVSHYNPGRTNGFFYKDWYYVGPRICASDLFAYGNTDPANAYNVWRYNEGCGCCPNGGWTYERRALITCK
jgi:hypothetical protein